MRGNIGVIRAVVCIAFLALSAVPQTFAQQYDPSLFSGLQWRLVGPYRGGRALSVTGIPSQPLVYYFGGAASGVWKTVDGGQVWKPMFDKQPVSSVGAIAVAPSDPNIVYAGTGEADIRGDNSYGDGIYKSIDAGKTWTNVGLRETQHIAKIVIDPQNPDIILVAALGHAYGPNPERGVYRSTDAGKTWTKVLYTRRPHRGHRSHPRSCQSACRLRRHVGGLSHAMEPEQRRPQQRFISVYGRRR